MLFLGSSLSLARPPNRNTWMTTLQVLSCVQFNTAGTILCTIQHCRCYSVYNTTLHVISCVQYNTAGTIRRAVFTKQVEDYVVGTNSCTAPCFQWAWNCVRASDRAADRSEAASVLTSSTPTWLCGTVVFRCGNVVGRCGIVVCRCGIIVCRCGNMVSRWVIEVCRCGISFCRCGIVVCSCTTVVTGMKL